MDHQQTLAIAQKYAQAVREALGPCQIFLFGSWAKNNATENSDIDIAVLRKEPFEDFWETSTQLWLLKKGIDYAIEPILLDPADDRSGFVQEVLSTGIPV